MATMGSVLKHCDQVVPFCPDVDRFETMAQAGCGDTGRAQGQAAKVVAACFGEGCKHLSKSNLRG